MSVIYRFSSKTKGVVAENVLYTEKTAGTTNTLLRKLPTFDEIKFIILKKNF